MLFENQIQTASTSPCRTQVQPVASFLVCSLIFIEYKYYAKTLCHGRQRVFFIFLKVNLSTKSKLQQLKSLPYQENQ